MVEGEGEREMGCLASGLMVCGRKLDGHGVGGRGRDWGMGDNRRYDRRE